MHSIMNGSSNSDKGVKVEIGIVDEIVSFKQDIGYKSECVGIGVTQRSIDNTWGT
jgi:hypothetical protein